MPVVVAAATPAPPPLLTATTTTVASTPQDAQQHAGVDFELPVHEQGWMPKPAVLHAGKSRSCAVCFAPLQYSNASSWDEYLKSEEYLGHLQLNLLNDSFIRGLICGENYFGDLPTEHRMHPQRRMKCRQNVDDHVSMNSAGLLDSSDKDKSLVRTLEELLIDGLPTPTFTYVLERRFAIIFHSAKIVSTLMKSARTQKLRRPLADATPHVELHHVAIHALSTLLGFFDYSGENSRAPFVELSRMLCNFPPLSLLSFWSPPPKAPEEEVVVSKDQVEATHTSPRHSVHSILDSSDSIYWLTAVRPGVVHVTIALTQTNIVALQLKWLALAQPTMIQVQAKVRGSTTFETVKEFQNKPTSPFPDRLELPPLPPATDSLRLALSGVPSTNKDGTYGIINLRLLAPVQDTVAPHTVMADVETWLVNAVLYKGDTSTADKSCLAVDACQALQTWTLATGSLTALMRLVHVALALRQSNHVLPLVQTCVDASCNVLSTVEAHLTVEKERIQHAVPSTESRKIRAGFEATLGSSGTTIEDGGATVRTRETSYQHAVVNSPISTGKASWKFRLDTDTTDDEMTCFGAAILPVTVSGYDSSPSLWMLRGYNGNLYARGHKLSRSIGKVHPGDVVQIDVDMNVGTMSYTINTTEFGVVFTDLSGHEVYPAVSFYGSGKVITLLSLHKWGDSPASVASGGMVSANADPIYVSTLPEYEYAVGHGRFGRGNLLGYTGEANNNTANGLDPSSASPSTTISVQSEARQRSLSTHPPARGEAFVTYDLGRAYATVSGGVALNDDVSNEVLAQRGISVVFSLVGDAQVLWKSKPVTNSSHVESFSVPIANVRMLEFRVSCSGSNHGAHAIWVDPQLTAVNDWTCGACTFANKGTTTVCAVCHGGDDPSSAGSATAFATSVPSAAALTAQLPPNEASDSLTLVTSSSALLKCAHPLDEVATSLLDVADRLGAVFLANKASYQVSFEEAFCIQPNTITFELLSDMIQSHLSTIADTDDERTHALSLHRCQLLLQILGRQLTVLDLYEPLPQQASGKCRPMVPVLANIRSLLESLAHIHVSNPMSPAKTRAWTPVKGGVSAFGTPGAAQTKPSLLVPLLKLQTTAAQALVDGLSLLYPASWDRTTLLLTLLRSYAHDRFEPPSARYLVLSKLLALLALPGDMGVLTFFPLVPDRLHSSQVQEIMTHILTDYATAEAPTTSIAADALACVQTFQLFLLSQVIELTKSPRDSFRVVIQDMTMRYSELLLTTVRKSLEHSLDSPSSSELSPVIRALLPPFVSGLCLLRRQTWLVRPLLPKLTMVLRVLDVICGQDEAVRKSERRLLALDQRLSSYAIDVDDVGKWQVDKSPTRVQKQLYNVFSKLYTGEKDHFEGQIGFQFEAMASFTLVALGRSVNPARNGGKLLHKHTVRLWDEASQALLGSVTVSTSSPSDGMGYVYDYLDTPLRLSHGKLYRLTTQEFANGGDPWYKKENLPDEEYDRSFIKILRDCYASGSTGFPNSQNLTGAAYGVPTFLVEEDNPMDTLPWIVPMDGLQCVKFNAKRKAASIAIGHLGNTLTVMGESGLWRTVWCTSAVTNGVHVFEYIVKSSRVGGGVSGHLCIGFECGVAGTMPTTRAFLGQTKGSIGFMPAIGCLWNEGTCVRFGSPTLAIHNGDVFAMTIDNDRQVVGFAHNGQSVGDLSLDLPPALVPAVSVYGVQDVVDVRPGGVAKSTLQLHWLLDVLNTTASLAGRFAGTIISGSPIDGVEEELQPWLQSTLLSGGLMGPSDNTSGAGMGGVVVGATETTWSSALKNEGPFQNPRYNLAMPDKTVPGPGQILAKQRKSSSSSLLTVAAPLDETDFGRTRLVVESPKLVQWLDAVLPDSLMWRRQETFPQVETAMIAALIKHAPPHLLHEAQAVIESQEYTVQPSADMALLWKCILTLRHWLIKSKHEYRAKQIDDVAPPVESAPQLSVWEQKLTLPRSFDAFVEHVQRRAEFLCHLEPPAETPNRWSSAALSNLAEKWTADQPPPPSLQPMVDRWRSLTLSDRSKWNGLVQVLQAQHNWRTRRRTSSNHVLDAASLGGGNSATTFSDDVDPPSEGTTTALDGIDDGYLSAMLRACDLYVRNGVGAPPEVLYALLERRYTRSGSRVYGLEAMKTILNCISFDTCRSSAVLFLRPALRGFTEDERLARETYLEQPQSLLEGSAFRPTVRHHYLKGLEGCSRPVLKQVQEAFMELYGSLAQMLAKASSQGASSKPTPRTSHVWQQSLIGAWAIDFEPRDHEFLLHVDILGLLTKLFSVATLSSNARQDIACNHNPASMGHPFVMSTKQRRVVVTEWHPLAEDYVRKGLLGRGSLTKRAVLQLMLQAPPYAKSPTVSPWSASPIPSSFKQLVSKHTASSTVLAYSDFLRSLHGKLIWATKPSDLGRKVLQLNVGEDVSVVEFPMLPSVHPTSSSFSIEMWMHPTELQGYSTLRSEVGFADGSVHVELVENRMQVAIAGNVPREQLFDHPFATHVWHHVAVLYDHDKQVVDLIVNGRWTQQLSYQKTCAKVHWRPARLGSWISDLASTQVQRKFKGLIAELRVWLRARTVHDVSANYHRRSPPLLTDNATQTSHPHVFSYHLDDGDGELAVCAESTQFNALLTKCHWSRMNVPVWDIDATEAKWTRGIQAIQSVQRQFRRWRHARLSYEMRWIKEAIHSDELHEDLYGLSDESEDDEARPVVHAAPSVENLISRVQLQQSAWIVFRLLGIVAISGIRERVEVEAVQAAESAKNRRLDKDKIQQQKTADAASDVAKSAATSTALEVPIAQRLWFSVELHRKVFEGIERELAAATKLIHDAEKLIRAQQPSMLRSMSTPVHQSSQEAAPLEPLEVEAYVFNLLVFLISQSDTYPAQEHLSKPAVLRELLLLLRMGSPRTQRLVQLLLRQVARVVTPARIGTILGMDTVFLDLLLDRVSDSICGSDAEPMSQSSMRESLANPLGFNTGQIFLALAAESVALLRLLLREPAWTTRVSDVLSAAIRNAAPVVTQAGNPSNIRTRVVVLRAMGALCVLGAHLDCLRIGGKVEVQGSSTDEAPSVATLISRTHETARVVFEDGSKVQQVCVSDISPIEEIPSLVTANVNELMPPLLHFATLQDDSLWRAQLRSRALLALESFLKQDRVLATAVSLVQTALTPLNLPSFVTTPALQERSRSILSRLIEASTPLGPMMFKGLPDPTPIVAEKRATETKPQNAPPPRPPVSLVRQGFAATLVSMGFEMDLCLIALEHARDDPNAAVEWLMGDQAIVYRRNLASASSASTFCQLNDTTSREEKAQDLQVISGMPMRLVLAALDICGGDANRAVEWLLEHGRRFSTPLNLHMDAFCQDLSGLHDEAALEVADQTDSLLFEPGQDLSASTARTSTGASATPTAASAGQAHDQISAGGSDVDNSLMTATLAPIVARDPQNGWGPLDPTYLLPNVVLTVSETTGPVAHLARSGTVVKPPPPRASSARPASPGVLLSFLNTENGALEEEYVCPTKVRRWRKVFDQDLVAVDSIYQVALRTEQALSTCYARRALLVFLSTDSSTALTVMGGSAPFVQLLKLVVGASFAGGTVKAVHESMVRVLKDHPTLSSVLVDECISHFVRSTQIAREGKVCQLPLQFESLHPYYHKSDYVAHVTVPSHTPLPVRVVFDKRSCLLNNSTLSFYSDAECKQLVAAFGPTKQPFADLWVGVRTFWYKLHCANDESEATTYGFRFQVHVMPSITWSNELDVLHHPSLDYACWLLEFLLSDQPHLDMSQLAQIYDALVQYLQSPRAPQKHKVIHLLLQLLVAHDFAKTAITVDVAPLQRIGELAIAKAQAEISKGRPFVSTHLLKLVELAVVVSSSTSKSTAEENHEPGKTRATSLYVAPIAPPIVVPTEASSMLAIIAETVHLSRVLLHSSKQALSQELVVLMWLDLHGASATLEYNELASDTLEFHGAHSLRLCFDPRFDQRDDVYFEVGTRSETNRDDTIVFAPVVIISDVMDVVGNVLRYTFVPTTDHSTMSVTVTAVGMPLERQLARCTVQDLEKCAANVLAGQWTPAMDAQLVDWVNFHVESQGEGVHADLLPADIRLHPTLDGLRCSLLLHLPWSEIQLRYALLRCFNTRLAGCISLLNLNDSEYSWTIAHQLRQLSHCVFLDLKLKLVEAAIEATVVVADATSANNGTARITLDRLRALESREDREVEPSGSECFFVQAFRQLHSVDPKSLRRKIDSKGRLFSVKFRGEEGVDWGGVYREGTNSMVDDLFSSHINLFLLCPNGQHNTGANCVFIAG
ncbi:hypothetical protein, variant 1 [Aphanomyces invadans]|uniref:B30.2/SPRY domain-containing protein n=1 Tax=Aphanomyces invadans TaxID=157072 RepID=A0A024UNZ6_9STRA|nr:hypothetical protein, variant 1 [Aphanomyces invadans]ETW08019.1 hypothetical protein, variant 1 [Aphanomyces invadans]|eukprot:XP_008864112.1 hypothetical protein, variant 1 [Aphanomyces invadans]